MNLRTFILSSNVALLVIIFTSLFIDSGLLVAGVLLGIVFSLPSIVAWFAPQRISNRILLRINLFVMFVLSLITIIKLYFQLLDTSGQPVVGLVVILFLALALCAILQLLILSSDTKSETINIDDFLQGVYGGPSIILMLSIAVIITGMFQSLIFALSGSVTFFEVMQSKFLQRGIIPYICLALFFWGILLLAGNYLLLRSEVERIKSDIQAGLKETQSATCGSLLRLFSETRTGNSKAKKIDCIEQLFEQIWHKSEYLYSLPRYANWAIPIMGFIGTVLGISLAAESIGGLIGSPDTNFSSALGDAIAPLGIAFDTTLVALSLSVVLMLIQTLSQRWQERQLQRVEQQIKDAI